jgi:hypothetical protein
MRSSFFIVSAGTILALVAGCEQSDKVSAVGPEARQAISAAATAHYPGHARTSDEVQVAAINYQEKDYLELHNLGTQSVPASNVWVNGTFMSRIEGIAPKSYVTVKHGALLEAGPATNDLKHLNQPVAKVEIETDRGLYTVQGPTIKRD